jgi:chromosome segregation ATPase
MQASQPMRSAVLPSPSSMHFPRGASLPAVSPPAAAATQTSAQSALLQELQHQISIKTIALQTIQREYDSLLQKLERQRTKCATLEKKFEVSDVEINSLTDEKEKLQAQVAAMEYQVDELQESRDESRRQLVANGAQYMRIMEMANRLQTQSADDKKRWDAEKKELQQRIKLLEEVMVTGTHLEHPGHSPPSIVLPPDSGTTHPSSAETINVLRAEVSRLRMRTQTLETALHTMKEEGQAIQEAAKKLLDSGSNMERATKDALE